MALLIVFFTMLGFISFGAFGACVLQIFTKVVNGGGSKYGILYNANTGAYSDPYIRSEWAEYARYRANRWKWIGGTILCLAISFGSFYLAFYVFHPMLS